MQITDRLTAPSPESEPLCNKVVSAKILETYIRNDAERGASISSVGEIVYDYIASISPFYSSDDPYIDENDAIYMPAVVNNNE